jgi:hypothetical protein
MHLKCEEQKPCQRCRKKNIHCKWDNNNSASSISNPSPPARSLTTPVGEPPPPLPPIRNRGSMTQTQEPLVQDPVFPDFPAVANGAQAFHPVLMTTTGNAGDSSVLSDYLSNVIPNFTDPFNGLFTQGFSGTWTSRGIQDFGYTEPTLELDDMDLNFLHNYNTHIPFHYGDSPANVMNPSTPRDPADPYNSAAIGSEAFQRSYWRFKPTKQDSGMAEEPNLSLNQSDADHGSPETRISLDRRTTSEKLTTATRDKILAMVAVTVRPENVDKAIQSFPSVELLDVLLQFFLTNPVSRSDSVFHISSFNPNKKRPELLAAMVAAGAVLTSDPAFTKLGFAIQECVRFAIPKIVRVAFLHSVVALR